ncbi:MAG: CDF family Co(II)/Ni(II) efflux transporter DmeF [Pirellulaceae bacterium]
MPVLIEHGTWNHDHTFGQDRRKPGELRTLLVVLLTTATMVLEIAAGVAYGSMALLADGLHMASHATALAIAMCAYIYARRHANDERFSFGTGKVNSLAGFTGAVLLAVFAGIMVWESIERLIVPISIAFNQALIVATVGLVVNGLSVVILGHPGEAGHDDDRHDQHRRAAGAVSGHDPHGHDHDHDDHDHHAHDHNLRSAYLHVLADALTSVLAIFALLAGKFYGLSWLDPAMGVVGAMLVARWSIGLVRVTSRVLLDRQGPQAACAAIRSALEASGDTTVTDLHLWSVAPGKFSLILAVATRGASSPDDYRRKLPGHLGLVHVTIEVNRDVERP